MAQKFILSGVIVSLGLLLGRIMGFVREASLATVFGVTSDADVAVLALTIPDVLVGLLVAGGLSAALIPEFKSLSEARAKILFIQVSVLAAVIFTVLVFFLGFATDSLAYLFAPGLSPSAAQASAKMIGQVLWLIPLTVLAGVSTAYLQSQGKFAVPAMGTFIFNLCIVVGLVGAVGATKNLDLLVYFILVGGLLRWGSQLWALRSCILWKGVFASFLPHKKLFWRYVQAVMSLGVLTLFPVVARAFASLSGEGGVAMMNYAWRLVELPLGLVITVLAVVLFPKLSEMYAQSNEQGFLHFLNEGLFWSLLLAAAIMGPMLASPETFVVLVYGWGGGISPEKISTISLLLQVAIVILPFQAVIAMSIAAFNARKNTKFPMKVNMIVFLLLLPMCWLAESKFGIIGVIISILACYMVISIMLLGKLKKIYRSLSLLALLKAPLIIALATFLISFLINMFAFPEFINIILFLVTMTAVVLASFVRKGGVGYIRGLEARKVVK